MWKSVRSSTCWLIGTFLSISNGKELIGHCEGHESTIKNFHCEITICWIIWENQSILVELENKLQVNMTSILPFYFHNGIYFLVKLGGETEWR